MKEKFKNRIVGSGTANPADLKMNPLNWRKHPKEQSKALDDALSRLGWIQDVIVNKTTGHLIDGHLRVETAIRNKEKEIPVKYVELTEEEEKIALATFDPLTLMAEQDDAMLKQLLSEAGDDIDMSQFHRDYDKLIKTEHTEEELEAIPPTPKTVRTKQGDIYKMGNHVLMCGDATNTEDVSRLISIGGGALQVKLYLSDPPYGVDYTGGTKEHLKIDNDNMSDTHFLEFLTAAFRTVSDNIPAGSSFYIWHADTRTQLFREACNSAGLIVHQCLIWVKNHFVLGRQDYQWIHEPCLYGWKEGASHYFTDDRCLSTVIKDPPGDIKKLSKEQLVSILQKMYSEVLPKTVIEADKPLRNAEHPTMKPIRLLTQLILNSTRLGDGVLDTFGGSGSTLIACEETGRKCRMMELAPEYCDVIVERWEKLTGKHAELIREGENNAN